jgi:hypothetical protein
MTRNLPDPAVVDEQVISIQRLAARLAADPNILQRLKHARREEEPIGPMAREALRLLREMDRRAIQIFYLRAYIEASMRRTS